jgi:hypothetical protein
MLLQQWGRSTTNICLTLLPHKESFNDFGYNYHDNDMRGDPNDAD